MSQITKTTLTQICTIILLIFLQNALGQAPGYDGYPSTPLTEVRQLRKAQNSFVKFRNQLQMGGTYLASYTYEFYMRFIPYNQTSPRIFNGTMLDCSPHFKASVDQDKLTHWQAGGDSCEYRFKTGELVSSFQNQWVHYSYSYNNFTQSQNNPTQAMAMRFFINGQLTSICRIQNPRQVNPLVGRGLCYLGNSFDQQNSQQALNADLAYLVIMTSPRIIDFKQEVYRRYPSPDLTYTALYFRFDNSLVVPWSDYYFNRGVVQDFQMQNSNLVSVNEPRGICECYGEPQNLVQIQNGKTTSSSFKLKESEDLSKEFTFDFWINLKDDLETAGGWKELFILENVIRVRTINRNLEALLGDRSNYVTIPNSNLYYRQWIYIAFRVANRQVDVFRNGQKIHSFTFIGAVLSGNLVHLKHDVTFTLYRFRLLKTALSLQDIFFQWTYEDGSNNDNVDKRTFNQTAIVFDFILSDSRLSSTNYLTQNTLNATYVSNNYSLVINQTSFVFDQLTCGKDGVYSEQSGTCYDHGWTLKFIESDTLPTRRVFKNPTLQLSQSMTIEFWFKVEKPRSNNAAYLFMVEHPQSRRERIKFDINFTASSSIHSIGVGCFDIGDGYSTFIDQVNENFWYHIAWSSDTPTKRSHTLFFNSLLQQELKSSKNGAYVNIFLKTTAQAYLGNNYAQDKPFIGFIKELRVWSEFRTDQNIQAFRNIEVPVSQRSALPHYYRFTSDNSLLRIQNVNYTNQELDFILENAKSVDSPMRFTQELAFMTCPYGLYLHNLNCYQPKGTVKVNLIAYMDTNNQAMVIDSQIKFTEEQLGYYNLQYILFSSSPYNQAHINEKARFFNQSDVTNFSVENFKLNTGYRYQVQLRVRSKFFPVSAFDELYYLWLDINCPNFDFDNLNPTDQTRYIFSGQQFFDTSINILANTTCLQESYLNKPTFSWAPALGQDLIAMNNTLTLTTINSGQGLNIKNRIRIDDFPFVMNVTLKYNNLLLRNQTQVYSKQVKIRLTNQPVVFIFNRPTFEVYQGENLTIYANQSYVIQPGLEGRRLNYNMECPRRLFRSNEDYFKYCFMDYLGRFNIPAGQFGQMNIVPNIKYQFHVITNIRQAEQYTASKIVNVSWTSLSPQGVECPYINLPSSYNISKLDSYTQIFPEYRLNCQRDGYIANYEIEQIEWGFDVTNISYFRQQVPVNKTNSSIATPIKYNVSLENFFVNYQDYRYWSTLTDQARQSLQVGEQVPVTITYFMRSNEFLNQYILTKRTKFIWILTDFQIKLQTNIPTQVFDYSDFMFFNLSGTFDPQDPGSHLDFSWICPTSARSLCPGNQNYVNLTTEQRALMLWKFDQNYTLQVIVRNPRSAKAQTFSIPFRLLRPAQTQDISICPYFDFALTNQQMYKDPQENFLLTFTNNITDITINYPFLRTQCGSTPELSNQLMSLQVQDDSGKILQASQQSYMYEFNNQLNSIKLTTDKINSLENKQDYTFSVFMYFKNQQTQQFLQFNKKLIIRKQLPDNVLVAQFAQSYIPLMFRDILFLDASRSFDNNNLMNKNFSFIWECPGNLTDQNLCPNNSKINSFSLNFDQRNASNINTQGRIYIFRVQIFDHNRTSEWAFVKVFIQPDSPTRECLTASTTDRTLTSNINTNFRYPLFEIYNSTLYCNDVKIESQDIKVQYLDFTGPEVEIRGIPIDSSSMLARINYQNMIDKSRDFMLIYQVSYSILNEFYSSTVYSQLFTYEILPTQLPINQYQIKTKTVINLEQDLVLNLEVFTNNQSLPDLRSATVIWRCDVRMRIDNICSTFRGNQAQIRLTDIGLTNYQTRFIGGIFKIDALVDGRSDLTISANIHFTALNKTDTPADCKIVSNQFLQQYMNITRFAGFLLQCSDTDKKLLLENNVQYKWSLPMNVSIDAIIDGSDLSPYLKLKPLSLQQYKQLEINLTITYPSYEQTRNMIFYTHSFSTSQLTSPNLLDGQYTLSQTFGYFFQTSFSLLLTGWDTLLPVPFKQNLFYSLRSFDGTVWFTIVPMQLIYQNKAQFDKLTLPYYQRLVLDVRNNYGEMRRYEFKNYDIYYNQNMQATQLAQIKRQSIDQLSQDDPVRITNEIFQLVQIIQRFTKSQLIIQLPLLDYTLDNLIIAAQLMDSQLTRDKVCLLDEVCIRLKQNGLLILSRVITIFSQQLTQIQKQKCKSLMNSYFFQESMEIFTTDLNHNIDSIVNYLSNQCGPFSDELKQNIDQKLFLFSLSLMVPGAETFTKVGNNSITQVKALTTINDSEFLNNLTQVKITQSVIQEIYLIAGGSSSQQNVLASVTFTKQTDQAILNSNKMMTDQIIEIKIIKENGDEISIENLKQPIEIKFQVLKANNLEESQCAYRQDSLQKWNVFKGEDYTLYQDGSIICKAFHLTQFTLVEKIIIQEVQSLVKIQPFMIESGNSFTIGVVVTLIIFAFAQLFACYVSRQQIKTQKLKLILKGQHDSNFYGRKSWLSGSHDQDLSKLPFLKIFKQSFLVHHSFTNLLLLSNQLRLTSRLQLFLSEVLIFTTISAIYFSQVADTNSSQTFIPSIWLAIGLIQILYIPFALLSNLINSRLKYKVKNTKQNESCTQIQGASQIMQNGLNNSSKNTLNIETLNIDVMEGKMIYSQHNKVNSESKITMIRNNGDQSRGPDSNDFDIMDYNQNSLILKPPDRFWKTQSLQGQLNPRPTRRSLLQNKNAEADNENVGEDENEDDDQSLKINNVDMIPVGSKAVKYNDSLEIEERRGNREFPHPLPVFCDEEIPTIVTPRKSTKSSKFQQLTSDKHDNEVVPVSVPEEILQTSRIIRDEDDELNRKIEPTGIIHTIEQRSPQRILNPQEQPDFTSTVSANDKDFQDPNFCTHTLYFWLHFLVNSCLLTGIIYLCSLMSQPQIIAFFISLVVASLMSTLQSLILAMIIAQLIKKNHKILLLKDYARQKCGQKIIIDILIGKEKLKFIRERLGKQEDQAINIAKKYLSQKKEAGS